MGYELLNRQWSGDLGTAITNLNSYMYNYVKTRKACMDRVSVVLERDMSGVVREFLGY